METKSKKKKRFFIKKRLGRKPIFQSHFQRCDSQSYFFIIMLYSITIIEAYHFRRIDGEKKIISFPQTLNYLQLYRSFYRFLYFAKFHFSNSTTQSPPYYYLTLLLVPSIFIMAVSRHKISERLVCAINCALCTVHCECYTSVAGLVHIGTKIIPKVNQSKRILFSRFRENQTKVPCISQWELRQEHLQLIFPCKTKKGKLFGNSNDTIFLLFYKHGEEM